MGRGAKVRRLRRKPVNLPGTASSRNPGHVRPRFGSLSSYILANGAEALDSGLRRPGTVLRPDPDLIDGQPLAGLLSTGLRGSAADELIREGRYVGRDAPRRRSMELPERPRDTGRCRCLAHGVAAARHAHSRAGGRYGLRLRRGCGTATPSRPRPPTASFGSPDCRPGWALSQCLLIGGTQTWLDPQHASRLPTVGEIGRQPDPQPGDVSASASTADSFMPFGCPGGADHASRRGCPATGASLPQRRWSSVSTRKRAAIRSAAGFAATTSR